MRYSVTPCPNRQVSYKIWYSETLSTLNFETGPIETYNTALFFFLTIYPVVILHLSHEIFYRVPVLFCPSLLNIWGSMLVGYIQPSLPKPFYAVRKARRNKASNNFYQNKSSMLQVDLFKCGSDNADVNNGIRTVMRLPIVSYGFEATKQPPRCVIRQFS